MSHRYRPIDPMTSLYDRGYADGYEAARQRYDLPTIRPMKESYDRGYEAAKKHYRIIEAYMMVAITTLILLLVL
jgi:hypothetical protein